MKHFRNLPEVRMIRMLKVDSSSLDSLGLNRSGYRQQCTVWSLCSGLRIRPCNLYCIRSLPARYATSSKIHSQRSKRKHDPHQQYSWCSNVGYRKTLANGLGIDVNGNLDFFRNKVTYLSSSTTAVGV